MGFVYLLCDSGQDNLFKIGVTKNDVNKRIKKLQTGNGNEIFLVKCFKTSYPYYIERMLHQKHCPGKKIGEWFELTPSSVLDFEKDCLFFEELADKMKDNPFFVKNLK